ncbi:MAG: DUF6090 family protein [Cyclobacteriaceae bacterium]
MKNINWFDHIANLLVVILGISIAFYLESYKDDKASRQQEQKYMASLIEDLQADLAALDTLGALNKSIGESLVKLSNASVGISYDSDSLVGYLLGTQYNPPFSPQLTTYESLKASGRMDLISDFDIRNQVVELYEQYYRGTKQYDDAIDENLRDFYKPFYMKNIVFTGRNTINTEFLKKTEFRNITFAYRYLFLAKTEFYKQVRIQVESTLKSLKQQSYD